MQHRVPPARRRRPRCLASRSEPECDRRCCRRAEIDQQGHTVATLKEQMVLDRARRELETELVLVEVPARVEVSRDQDCGDRLSGTIAQPLSLTVSQSKHSTDGGARERPLLDHRTTALDEKRPSALAWKAGEAHSGPPAPQCFALSGLAPCSSASRSAAAGALGGRSVPLAPGFGAAVAGPG